MCGVSFSTTDRGANFHYFETRHASGCWSASMRVRRKINSGVDGRILSTVMRRLASIVAILLLLTAAAPVMACLTSVVMSHAESACCRVMHGQCGHMEKMGCCRTEVRTDEHPQLAATSPATPVQWVCVAHLPSLSTPLHSVVSTAWHAPEEHSPPGLLTAKTTVLRI